MAPTQTSSTPLEPFYTAFYEGPTVNGYLWNSHTIPLPYLTAALEDPITRMNVDDIYKYLNSAEGRSLPQTTPFREMLLGLFDYASASKRFQAVRPGGGGQNAPWKWSVETPGGTPTKAGVDGIKQWFKTVRDVLASCTFQPPQTYADAVKK